MSDETFVQTRTLKQILARIAVVATVGAGWILLTAAPGLTSPVSGC